MTATRLAAPADLDPFLAAIPMPAMVMRASVVVAANDRFCALLGRTCAELLESPDPFHDFIAPEDADRVLARHQARSAGQNEPDEYDFAMRGRDGSAIPTRVRVARYLPAGPAAFLLLFSDERNRSRNAELIRAFVDVAVSAQRERTQEGIFRLVQDRLHGIGLSVHFSVLSGSTFELLELGGAEHAGIAALRARWPRELPIEAFQELRPSPGSAHGTLIDDLPGVIARALGKKRDELGPGIPATAVFCLMPVEGVPRFALSATGPGLDATVASAFGLFGQQLGASLETLRRMDELARSNRELLAVNQVARASAALASGESLSAALGRLAEVASLSAAAILRREEEGLLVAVQRGFQPRTLSTAGPLDGATPWAESARSGEPVLFTLRADGTVAGDWRLLVLPPGGVVPLPAAGSPPGEDHNAMALPLRVGDAVNGVLLAVRDSPVGREDLRLLSTLGAQLAVTLLNTALFEQTQRRVDELSLLLELGQNALGNLDLAHVLQAGTRAAVRVLRCSGAYLFLPDAAGTALQLAAAEDPDRSPELVPGFTLPLSTPALTTLAFSSRRPRAAVDTQSDPRIAPLLSALFRCRSCLAVPLMARDAPIGVLKLMSRGERIFGAQEVRLASHVAQLLSAAIENARLYAEQRARAEEMTLLNEVSRSFAGALEIKPLLAAAGQALGKLVNATNWFIMLRERKGTGQGSVEVLRSAACKPEHEEFMRGVELRLDQPSLSAEAVRKRRAVQAQEPELSQVASRQLVERFRERSVLVVPLIARDEVLGVVALDDTHRARVFTEAEMGRTTAVCQQIALALLSARLYQDLRESYAELARTQAELIERERLAALGEMAASVAHEVRNPLGVMFNSIGGLRRLLQPSGDVRLLLDIVGEEADRLNRMVGDLLDYSRPLRPALQPVPLHAVLDEAIVSARQPGEENPVEVRLHLEPGLPPVSADARLLRQALVNLFTNSFHAMPHGGALTVSAAQVLSDDGPQVRISIHDTGFGIPPDARGKIFQPFFTTKPTGTGLGLAVVKRIVDGHGGRIQLAECERGTEFHLILPLSELDSRSR